MEKNTLVYALKNILDIQTSETFYIHDNKIYIEFSDGRSLKISDDEIYYQAVEYLNNQISYINEQKK
jgi:ribosomal protein S4E